jgi:hypothetical protein
MTSFLEGWVVNLSRLGHDQGFPDYKFCFVLSGFVLRSYNRYKRFWKGIRMLLANFVVLFLMEIPHLQTVF